MRTDTCTKPHTLRDAVTGRNRKRNNSAQLRCFENGNDDFGVEAFWIGDAARVGYFVPLNGPLNGHPPSIA